ncbi:MAG: hypothetical protein A3A86_01640 [Elusimicrobia bacterium RIFCSPLOWO2_01_FULL_60_11]|nr:MAG: hypothetical protein A3A86_01640 [Elusimicrobia bacterium RIFCSPLOWO2_01_FULL_60_11]
MTQNPLPETASLLQIPWTQKKWVRTAGVVLAVIAAFYAMVYADVVLRARDAYLQGEKYMRWHEDPRLKMTELNSKYEKQKAALDEKLSKKKINQDEYDRQLEIAAFDRDRLMEESSVKYAYVWYQTAYELFSPPESRWVRLSREKAPLAKEKWKDELRAKKIPFEDYMLE